MNLRRFGAFACVLGPALLFARSASAVDLPKIDGSDVRMDVTEASVVSQRFGARTTEGQVETDGGWGFWLNRLNASLNWRRIQIGARIDSTVYWNRPTDGCENPTTCKPAIRRDLSSRFPDVVYPAKLWATYSAPGLEVTLGDAYVQFGRGLVLSMRKIDDLGVDNTVRGLKVAWSKDPVALTLIGGYANPSRVDEPSGRALLLPRPVTGDARSPQPLYGNDRILGLELQAGRGLPVLLSTHAVRFSRCAPYAYDAAGKIVDNGIFTSPLGECGSESVNPWVSSLPAAINPLLAAKDIDVAGQSLEIPKLGPLGTVYVGVAVQRRTLPDVAPLPSETGGNAIYGSYSGTFGPVTNTLEIKSYRNFYPVSGSVDATRASAFSLVAYSAPPTAEVITQDSAFNFFNACVDGGRARSDVRLSKALMVWGQAIHARTKGEQFAQCDRAGTIDAGGRPTDELENRVWDGSAGIQWQWDKNRSYLYTTVGVRNDERLTGTTYYRESNVQYTLSKWLGGAYSLEFLGRHRLRYEEGQNLRGENLLGIPWREGENYTALKIAPKWVVSQGFEYTTRLGFPTYYWNGGITFRFTRESNIKLFAGQQRGGLRCVNGVCRFFPAFEGARVELTLRF